MSEPRYRTKPPPVWLQGDLIQEEPGGPTNPPSGPPLLPTRIIPKDHGFSLPAVVLRDVIDRTQRLVYFSAQVAAFGPAPSLAGISELNKRVRELATLRILPFSAGSFVIPAELDERAEIVHQEGVSKELRTSEIVATFSTMLSSFTTETVKGGADLPLGFIQSLEYFGRTLTRHAKRIEFAPSPTGVLLQPITIDYAFVDRVAAVSRHRNGSPQVSAGAVQGQLVELNVVKKTLLITLTEKEGRRTIGGSFTARLRAYLVPLLGKHVRLSGDVTFEQDKPKRVEARDCEMVIQPDDLFND